MIAGYRRLAAVALQELLVYRVAVLIWVVWSLLQIYLLSVFWTAVYGGVGAVAGVKPPVSIAMAGAYLVSLLLSYSLHFLLMALLACTAFWFTELQGVSAVFWLVLSLLSGAVVPLWFLPPFFQQLSSWLPFQGLVYVPVAIYIGRLAGGAVWLALLQQVIWIGVLSAVLALVWRAALRRLVVQGG